MRGDFPRTNEMHCSHFVIEDNRDPLFSAEEVKVSFRKDPHVSRIWTMSSEQLEDLQAAIGRYQATKQL